MSTITGTGIQAGTQPKKRQSQLAQFWRRLVKNKTALLGLAIIGVVLFFAIFADVFVDYSTQVIGQNAQARLQPPSWQHLFGTDAFGRDQFARIIHGARVSITIGLVATALAVVFGGLIGSVTAFYGGLVDEIIMRILDILMCIPPLLLALAIVAALGPGMMNMMIAITISSVPGFSRIVRSVILSIVEEDFIEAARACGTSDARTILVHILPNAMGPIIVQATMSIAGIILAAAGLSYIGMGIQPPRPEWGAMLADANTYMREYPHLVIFPGLALILTSLAFNLLGDGLRDALDPKLKS